jgi:hypothetical protein
MSLIIPANSLSGGYAVDNSARFNSGSSDSLTRTFSTPTSAKKFTISQWVKRSKINESQILLNQSADYYYFVSNNEIDFETTIGRLTTNRLFRDTNAWYHVVIVVDTTLGTADDRIKMFINGVQETSFRVRTNPSLNANFANFNSATQHSIAKRQSASDMFLNGYLAEQVFLDGTAAAITDLGEFDEDSGIWKPIDVSGLTFGTNGFYLDFEDSAALGDDVSGNGNNWTVNNLTSIDQTTDTPTNNFATYNPLINTQNIPTFAEGNLQAATTGAGVNGGFSTTGMSSGKWYAEFKLSAHSGTNRCVIGVTSNPAEENRNNQYLGQTAASYSYSAEIGRKYYNNTAASYGDSYTTNDIIGIALDLDNLKIYFSKNGTWQNSGDPESGATGTGAAFTVTAPSSTTTGFYFFGEGDESGTHSVTVQANFGNAPYTISSGNTDGNGYGNFEYVVPSGYLSLCTANLSEVLG